MKVEQRCKIIKKTWLNDYAVSMTLEAGDMVRTSPGGQFVQIRCGEGLLLRRPISVCVCGADEPRDFIIIAFEVRGEGTRWLSLRREGEWLDVLGLLGNNFQMKEGGRYLLAGGGVGVPPLLGCALRAGGSADAVLAFRDEEHVMLENGFSEACGTVYLCTDDGSAGEKAYAHEMVRRVLEGDSGYDGVLACGPKLMMKSVAQVAAELGVPCQVSLEERMGCGIGACLVCACDMKDGSRKHVCKDGPVFNAEEVDWDV